MSKIVNDNIGILDGMTALYYAVSDEASMDDEVVVSGHADTSTDPNTEPTQLDNHIDYLEEPLHVLPFTDLDIANLPKYQHAIRVPSLGSSKLENDLLYANWMREDVYEKYTIYPYAYVKVENYHPEVFPKTCNMADEFPAGTIIFPDSAPRDSAMLRDVYRIRQRGYDNNIEIHNHRLEIAAKAALLIYRCSAAQVAAEAAKEVAAEAAAEVAAEAVAIATGAQKKSKVNKSSNPLFDDIKLGKQLDEARENYNEILQNANYDVEYDHRARNALEEYVDAQNAVSVKANLTHAVVNEISRMSNPSADLSSAFDVYRANSCYGLWGKWYTPTTGFHRGIDIAFGEGVPIYSMCKGKVVSVSDSSELTYRTIQIEHPSKFRGMFLTYMHASFSIKYNNEIVMGQQIGTENSFMPGGGDSHTHIELNGNNTAKFGQNLHSVTDPVGSIAPYDVIEECFKEFYDAMMRLK